MRTDPSILQHMSRVGSENKFSVGVLLITSPFRLVWLPEFIIYMADNQSINKYAAEWLYSLNKLSSLSRLRYQNITIQSKLPKQPCESLSRLCAHTHSLELHHQNQHKQPCESLSRLCAHTHTLEFHHNNKSIFTNNHVNHPQDYAPIHILLSFITTTNQHKILLER